MIKSTLIILSFCLAGLLSTAQDSLQLIHEGYIIQGNSSRGNKHRIWLTAGSNAALWAGSLIVLNKAWYQDYPRTSFHFFNDNKEWNQMDKLGHVWTSYHVSRGSAEIWRWAGLSKSKSILVGSLSSVAYLSVIEMLDGYSREWGFSAGDMGANLIGAAAFGLQQFGWKDQRVGIKFSYYPYEYSADLLERRNQLFGSGSMERILKDYNGQTYWLSANLRSFMPRSKLPKWLNIAVGYGAEGMLGGRENKWIDEAGFFRDRLDIKRRRLLYLSPDIDFTKIKTKSKVLNNVLFMLNIIKFPAPALEYNSSGKFRVKGIAF